MEHSSIIFLHIPKTAGSTLRKVVKRQYRAEQTLEFAGRNWFEKLEEFHDQGSVDLKQINCVIGHFPFGIHHALQGEWRYFTMIREPVDWTLSFYYAMRTKPQVHPMMRPVRDKEMSLEEFLDYLLEIGAVNTQTRILSGLMDQKQVFPPYPPLPEEAIDLALANLSEYFDAVGLADRFDESLLLFKKQFGWKNIFVAKQNITTGRPKVVSLSQTAREKLAATQNQDLLLYEAVQKRFTQDIAQLGPAFDRELRRYRLANRLYSVAHRGLRKLRK